MLTCKGDCKKSLYPSWHKKLGSREDNSKHDMPIYYKHMPRQIPRNVLAQEEDPFFGRDVQHSPDMDARDAFVDLRCKKFHFQKVFHGQSKRNILKEMVERLITTIIFHTQRNNHLHIQNKEEKRFKYILYNQISNRDKFCSLNAGQIEVAHETSETYLQQIGYENHLHPRSPLDEQNFQI